MSNARKVEHFDREVEAVLAGTGNKRADGPRRSGVDSELRCVPVGVAQRAVS